MQKQPLIVLEDIRRFSICSKEAGLLCIPLLRSNNRASSRSACKLLEETVREAGSAAAAGPAAHSKLIQHLKWLLSAAGPVQQLLGGNTEHSSSSSSRGNSSLVTRTEGSTAVSAHARLAAKSHCAAVTLLRIPSLPKAVANASAEVPAQA